jgi:hypothetical protein
MTLTITVQDREVNNSRSSTASAGNQLGHPCQRRQCNASLLGVFGLVFSQCRSNLLRLIADRRPARNCRFPSPHHFANWLERHQNAPPMGMKALIRRSLRAEGEAICSVFSQNS